MKPGYSGRNKQKRGSGDSGGDVGIAPEQIAVVPLWYVGFLVSLTCHEAAQALVAKWGGDLTAYNTGQVSLNPVPVSYTHLRAHETVLDLVCRLLLEKKKKTKH